MDEDIDDYSDSKTDEFDVDQSIDDLGTISIDFAEENPVTINPKDDYLKCNNYDKRLSDIEGEPKNLNSVLENSSTNHVSLDADNDQSEGNKDMVSKLLDPFEQLEREFHWDEVAAIKPPPAFSGGQQTSRMMDPKSKISKPTKDRKLSVQSVTNEDSEEVKGSSLVNSHDPVYANGPSKR